MDVTKGVPGVNAAPAEDFESFWAYYLSQHLHPGTRQAHVIGTTVAVWIGGFALLRRRIGRLLKAPVYAYGLAFASHYLIEKNRPATLGGNVWWSIRADFRMLRRTFDGSINDDIAALRQALELEPGEVTLADQGALRAA